MVRKHAIQASIQRHLRTRTHSQWWIYAHPPNMQNHQPCNLTKLPTSPRAVPELIELLPQRCVPRQQLERLRERGDRPRDVARLRARAAEVQPEERLARGELGRAREVGEAAPV